MASHNALWVKQRLSQDTTTRVPTNPRDYLDYLWEKQKGEKR